MQYQKTNFDGINVKFESKNFLSIFGLYLFSLGAIISGYSFYILLETVQRVDRKIIEWSGQGLFWFLILFFISIFILFIPIEFFNVYKIYNASFKDLLSNILYSISISLFFLILFQYIINSETLIMNDISSIGKAVSFSGFITIPLFLFLQHTFRSSFNFIEKISFSVTLLVWVLSSQIFL